ncbi:hypothetical protein [Gayadomonas joobiniege]|uniref:hypothetical protein n=1 Tax=Gayadomonas joobiniege TaxID=1234606 RepID=UPI000375EA31|nr:hypothetical protein [Gayadomonas joobiniege]
MKTFIKVILGISLIISVAFIIYINDRGESRLQRKLAAYCQFSELAKELNSFYFSNGRYISERSWRDKINLNMLNQRCNIYFSEDNGRFKDIFGAAYKYETIDGGNGMRIARIGAEEDPQYLGFEQIMVFKLGKRVE